MKLANFVCALAVLLPPAWPAAGQDDAGSRALLFALNRALAGKDPEAFSKLFTVDADLRIAGSKIRFGRTDIAEAVKDGRIWSEVTPPHLVAETIRFITPEVALVDAEQVQYGSLALKQSAPVTLVLRRHFGEWGIASMRVGAPCRDAVPLGLTRRRD
jgi:uncharacterized protein (TIGR02246 family)